MRTHFQISEYTTIRNKGTVQIMKVVDISDFAAEEHGKRESRAEILV